MRPRWPLLFLLACALRAPAAAQTGRAPACGLIGTWRFIEIVDWDSAGHPLHSYGAHATGYLIYTETGHMSAQVDGTVASPGDSARVPRFNYFGTFVTDRRCHNVIHRVVGGSVLEYIGTSQSRPFRVRGDTLILGDDRTWRRTLVRARPPEP
jgi:Lipocalin-like domain